MTTFASEELSDWELSEMLARWVVPDPPRDLKVRVFSNSRRETAAFELGPAFAEPWYGGMMSRAASILIHAGVVALLLLVSQSPIVQKKIQEKFSTIYLPEFRPKIPSTKASGGGGGGQKMPAPASKGVAPKFALKQFIPPSPAIEQPKLPVVPTITAPAPLIMADSYGDPLSKVLGNSAGPGSNGFGAGKGGGIGDGDGNGYGPGAGGGIGGGVYGIGGDVSAPILIYKLEPEYSEEARKAKFSGSVLLSVIIDANGNTRDIRILRPLGLGLDEKAIEAVAKWRFRPALKGGKPVAVQAQVEVHFRLL